jgi:hypothetical protein
VVGQFENKRVPNEPGRNLAFCWSIAVAADAKMTLSCYDPGTVLPHEGRCRDWEVRYDSIVGQKLVAAGTVWRS